MKAESDVKCVCPNCGKQVLVSVGPKFQVNLAVKCIVCFCLLCIPVWGWFALYNLYQDRNKNTDHIIHAVCPFCNYDWTEDTGNK